MISKMTSAAATTSSAAERETKKAMGTVREHSSVFYTVLYLLAWHTHIKRNVDIVE